MIRPERTAEVRYRPAGRSACGDHRSSRSPGASLCILAFVFYFLTAVLAAVVAARIGRPPDIFVFIGLAFVLSVVGPLLPGIEFLRVAALGNARFLPFFASMGAAAALIPTDPWHDIGLAVFSLAWIAIGIGHDRSGIAGRSVPNSRRPSRRCDVTIPQCRARSIRHRVFLSG